MDKDGLIIDNLKEDVFLLITWKKNHYIFTCYSTTLVPQVWYVGYQKKLNILQLF